MNVVLMSLSEREAFIIRDIRVAMSKALSIGTMEDITIQGELSEPLATQVLIGLNLFYLIHIGNKKGIQTLLKPNIAMDIKNNLDNVVLYYKSIMEGFMPGRYTFDDVEMLRGRIKEALRAIKKLVSRILYISDCHFYHTRINTILDNRGFSSVDEMNEYMISQWNLKAAATDTVYILGDLSFGNGLETVEILRRLNGKKRLISGNHDSRYLKDRSFDKSLFDSVQSYSEIRDNGRSVVLSHYPIPFYNGQYRKDSHGKPLTYMLYGHLHNTHEERLFNQFILQTRSVEVPLKSGPGFELLPCNTINCFCMFSNYQPMTLDEWIEIDMKRRANFI